MKRKRETFLKKIIIIFIILLFTSGAYGEGIFTLAEVGQSQDEMLRELNKETKAYNAVKKAVERGRIKKGDSQDTIRRRYGEPVITLTDEQYAEKWVYKPGYATWFDGIKIYLFFDKDKKLEGMKMLNASHSPTPK